MKKITDHEFTEKCMVYIITERNGITDTECFSYRHYLNNQEKYKGKVLIITPPNVPVYFRLT